MIQKRMRHSKFKNTGILFELLTKQITADIISGKTISKAKDLLFKYFNENTELGKEWEMYSSLLSQKTKDESKAERLLSVVLETRKKLSNKKLNLEKYELIKEIKNSYPINDLLKTPVRNYRMLASICKTFENSSSSDLKFDINELYKAKTCIVEHILNKPKQHVLESEDEKLIEYYKEQSSETRHLAYKLLLEKLNTKYNTVLDDNQKEIIREYIYNISNTNSLGDYISNKIVEIKNSLSSILPKITNDVAKIKINEVVSQLNKVKPKINVKDNQVMVLLLSYELIKECKRILSKN
jgi:hypothetical protein